MSLCIQMRNNCNSYINNFLFWFYSDNTVKEKRKTKSETFNYLERPCIKKISPENEDIKKYIEDDYDYPTDSEIYDSCQ